MISLFEEVQLSKRSHKSLVKKLNNSYLKQYDSKSNPKPMNILLNCVLDQTLLHSKSNANISRLIAFFGLTLTSILEQDSLKEIAFQHLFKRLKSTLKHVRQRVCQLLEEFLKAVSEGNLEIDCDLLANISQQLLIRLQDKVPAVRAAAVNALMHLQDPSDKEDAVISGLLALLRIESAVTVRNATVKILSLCDGTKDALVLRLRDVSADVRVSVLNRFVEDTDIRQFSRASRAEIVQAILYDRQASVRSTGEKLLLNWLKLLNHDVSKFLNYFGPVENEKLVLMIAAWLAEKVFTDKSDTFEDLKQASISWKTATTALCDLAPADILWTMIRCQYVEQFMSKFIASKICDNILPPVDHLLNTFRDAKKHFDNLDQSRVIQFNLKYLIQLIPFYNFIQQSQIQSQHGDEATATVTILQDLESSIFKNPSIPYEVYQTLLDSVWRIDYVKQSPYIANLIVQFRQQIALDIDPNEEGAEEQKNDLSSRILLLIQSILQHKSYHREEMMECLAFVLNCLQQPVASLRAYATSCVALFCVFDADIRKQYLPVLKQVVVGEFEDELVQTEALKGLVDVCLVAGNDEFSAQDRMDIDAALLRQIQKNEENDYDDISLLTMESVVKLVFHGFSKDPALVAKLLHFFFVEGRDALKTAGITSSSSSNLIRMNQLLSIFLHSFLVNEESCFEIVRQSLPLFISDCVLAMKDERMEANALGNVSIFSFTCIVNMELANFEYCFCRLWRTFWVSVVRCCWHCKALARRMLL